MAGASSHHVAFYEGVLGTSMELQIFGPAEAAREAETSALAEMDRLEAIFSRYRADSELARWEKTFQTDVTVSPELAEVLALAERYRIASKGAFDPTLSGEPGPLWRVDGFNACRLTQRPANLNALAKGYIVDRAAGAAQNVPGVEAVLLNLGGDLRHFGNQPVGVAVTDPLTPQENAKPIASVRIRNQGMATSGNYRRGPHLIDPRTGEAADHIASATVVAKTTADADALATAFFVLSPRESLRLADECDVAVLLVLQNRKRHCNPAWRRLSFK